MSKSGFFSRFQQEDISIRGHAAKSPLFYQKVSMMMGVFTADLATIRRLLPNKDYRPLRVSTNRALAAIHCFSYHESDIGPYNEVSLSFGVQVQRSMLRSPLRVLKSLATDDYHAYVHALPVTTDVALHGGIDFFNFPKFLADISFEDAGEKSCCTLRDRDTQELILSFSGRKLPTKHSSLRLATMHSYPQMNDEMVHAKVQLNLIDSKMSLFRQHATLTYGEHSHAEVFKELKLGKMLQYMYAPKCEAVLFPPEAS